MDEPEPIDFPATPQNNAFSSPEKGCSRRGTWLELYAGTVERLVVPAAFRSVSAGRTVAWKATTAEDSLLHEAVAFWNWTDRPSSENGRARRARPKE